MSYVAYNSQKIIPAPLVNISRERTRTADGSPVGQKLNITLHGKFVAQRGGLYSGSGYPADHEEVYKFADLLDKMNQLKNLFTNADYAWLEIKPDPEESAVATKWIAKVEGMEFPEGMWTEVLEYTVRLSVQVGDTTSDFDAVKDFSESWELQYIDDPEGTYALNHSIRCSSQEQYIVALASIKEGWKKAYDYVNQILGGPGVDSTIIQSTPGFALSASFLAYNHILTQTIDEATGDYSIQETWRLSTEAYHEDQQIEVRYERDVPDEQPTTVVTVSGNITGYRTDIGAGYDVALARWQVVQGTLFASAQNAATGITLRTTPKSKSTGLHAKARTVNYSYIYDEGTVDAYNEMTVDVSTADSDCNRTVVRVTGNIIGVKTDNKAYANALTFWNTFKSTIASEASTAYLNAGGLGTLRSHPTDKSEGHSKHVGRISYSQIFNDWPTPYVHDQTIVSNYAKKEDHGSVAVSGTITAFCYDGYATAKAYWETLKNTLYSVANPNYSGYKTLAGDAQSQQVTFNERARTVSYSYTFDDFSNASDVDIVYNLEEGQDNCGHKRVRMDGNIVGKRTQTNSAWENARIAFGIYEVPTPDLVADYISGGRVLSKSIGYNEFNNRINFSYIFTDEVANYIIDETVTKETDPQDCGYYRIVQNGTVTGMCTGGSDSSMTNAEIGLLAVTAPSVAGTRTRVSVARSARRGTIQYQYEYTTRTQSYYWEESISERDSIDQKGILLTISGNIVGYCTGDNPDENTKYANALVGWSVHAPATPSGYKKIESQVTKNARAGTINYQYNYKQLSSCISGAIDESVTITNEYPNDIFAVAPILGGQSIIQDKGGTTVYRKTIQVDARVDKVVGCGFGTRPDVSSIINLAEPSADVVVVEKDTESWMPWQGRYSRTKSWVYVYCS